MSKNVEHIKNATIIIFYGIKYLKKYLILTPYYDIISETSITLLVLQAKINDILRA